MNFILNMLGLSKVWDLVDGYKTRIAAAAGILSGAASLLQEFLVVEGRHNFQAMLSFISALPQDPAWLLIVASLAVLGLLGLSLSVLLPYLQQVCVANRREFIDMIGLISPSAKRTTWFVPATALAGVAAAWPTAMSKPGVSVCQPTPCRACSVGARQMLSVSR